VRVPFGWLQEFVKLDYSPEETCDHLIMLGFSDAEVLANEFNCLEDFIVGRASKVSPHPHESHLQLVEVNVGFATLPSVCGAPNLAEGRLYAVALPGSKLGSGTRVEPAQIAGVDSKCILCSGWEAWLDDSRDELLEIPEHIAPGTKLVEALKLDEPVIEMEVTPNRGDWLGLIGIARELAALHGKELIIPEPSFKSTGSPIEDLVSVEIVDTEGCPRYGAMVLEKVNAGRSSPDMRARLRLAGLRPINSVVDVANLVMFETGHPLHAFDLDTVTGGKVLIRRAAKGERIAAIDGNQYDLAPTDLVIADSEKPIALAGIIGGRNSEVTADTKRVLVEGAFFDRAYIWRTSKRLGLNTEASFRFARVVDVGAVLYVLTRAASLIQQGQGCDVADGRIDLYPNPIAPRHIMASPRRINRLLGISIPEQEICEYLERLGFLVSPGKELEVIVPTRRSDVDCEASIAEEVGRLYGYDRMEGEAKLACRAYGKLEPGAIAVRQASDRLVGMGLSQIVTDPMMGPQNLELYGMKEQECVGIRNPVGVQNSYMRPSLLPGMAGALVANEHSGIESVGLFELGRVYGGGGGDFREDMRLAIGLSGARERRTWYGNARDYDFYDLKGIVDSIMAQHGLTLSIGKADVQILHPGRQAAIVVDGDGGLSEVGVMGELGSGISEALDSRRRLYVAEIDFACMVPGAGRISKYSGLQRYPAVKRDIAVVVSENVLESDVRGVILSSGGSLVERLELFDIYEGDQIPRGTKSLAYAITMRSPERTLTEAEADRLHKSIEDGLKSQLDARIRTN
jgi:phenylalanyl-tRNA synthetase beta chain